MFLPRNTDSTGAMEAVCEVDEVSATEVASAVGHARGGDMAAFERLYRDNVGRIHALCLRLSGDPALAEELTQDVFVRAWEKLDSYRGESAFSTWLHRLAVNVVLGQRRADGRRHTRVMTTDDPGAYELNGVAPLDVGARMDLDRAMAELPSATRTVFVMHDVEGFTHEEIAQLTGRAEGTCKALLHRARRALRERLT
jgi:RNA polymerase sigma-70 factor (ECF subfamily)